MYIIIFAHNKKNKRNEGNISMKKLSIFSSLPFKLLVGVILGLVIGLALNAADSSAITVIILNIVVTLKYILGQIIQFCVPLIIIGFIAPSITKLGNSASRMLTIAVLLAYASSIGAAFFSMTGGYILILIFPSPHKYVDCGPFRK